MYCYHCGKEISPDAAMCPNCGAPTKNTAAASQQVTPECSDGEIKATALSAIALTLSIISFVTGVIFGAFFFVFASSSLLLMILDAVTILPALTALCLGIYLLTVTSKKGIKNGKTMSIVAVVLSAVVMLFLFIAGCVIVAAY